MKLAKKELKAKTHKKSVKCQESVQVPDSLLDRPICSGLLWER